MGEIFKKFLWFVGVCVIVYVAYTAYVGWWDTGTLAEKKRLAEQYVTQKTGEVTKKIEQTSQEYASQVVSEAKKTVLQAVKEKISSALSGIEKKMVDSAASLVGVSSTPPVGLVTIPALTGGGNTRLIPTSSDFVAPAPPATFITRVDTPIIFSINRNTSYTVDWGDTIKEAGTVEREVVKLLSHTWPKEGDYTVTITVKGSGIMQEYVFPIRVFQ